MNVLLDNIIFHIQKVGGISVYWKELLMRLIYESDIDLYCINKDGTENYIYRELCQSIDLSRIKSLSPIINHRYLPVILQNGNYICHSSYYRPFIIARSKKVVTVHDFMYERFDSGLKRCVHSLQKKIAIANADVVICISQSTKQDLLKYYPEFAFKDIRVIYNGVGATFRNLGEALYKQRTIDLGFSGQFLLVVGNRIGCKNFAVVAEAFNFLSKSFHLVIVGHSLSENEKKMLEKSIDRVHVFTGVNEEELNCLYNRAFALLFPSLYEGFGIPIVEAMKAGCPVITTEYSSIPEVASDAGVYMQSNTAKAMIECVTRLNNSDFRKEIMNRGLLNSERFSWDNTYKQLLDIYKELYGEM